MPRLEQQNRSGQNVLRTEIETYTESMRSTWHHFSSLLVFIITDQYRHSNVTFETIAVLIVERSSIPLTAVMLSVSAGRRQFPPSCLGMNGHCETVRQCKLKK